VPQRPKRTVRAVGFGVGRRMGKFVTAPAAEICVDRIRMPAITPIFYSSRGSTWHKSLILLGVG
jgi:hypothetical protein